MSEAGGLGHVHQLDALPPVEAGLEDQLGGGGQGPSGAVIVHCAALSNCHTLCMVTT